MTRSSAVPRDVVREIKHTASGSRPVAISVEAAAGVATLSGLRIPAP
ncbi:hypothetical protein OG828_08385 [Streptomyces sp. NBC_00457]|nr:MULTISPECIES: hypothetical protein [unclassified Streptomyces]